MTVKLPRILAMFTGLLSLSYWGKSSGHCNNRLSSLYSCSVNLIILESLLFVSSSIWFSLNRPSQFAWAGIYCIVIWTSVNNYFVGIFPSVSFNQHLVYFAILTRWINKPLSNLQAHRVRLPVSLGLKGLLFTSGKRFHYFVFIN